MEGLKKYRSILENRGGEGEELVGRLQNVVMGRNDRHFNIKTCQFLFLIKKQPKGNQDQVLSLVQWNQVRSSHPSPSSHFQIIKQPRENSSFQKSKVERPKVPRTQQQIRRCLSLLDCLSGMRKKIF